MAAPTLGPTLDEIQQARPRIAGMARRTPLERSASLSQIAGHDIYLKLECWQPTRSFKIRGALNAVALLEPAQRARGLVTASAGNHGQAIAFAARRFGARASVFLPANAPAIKRRRIAALGAAINDECASYDDAEVAAQAFAADTGATYVHAYADRSVVAGQGTMALEILEDLPDVHGVIVPVGGGGLVAGIGIALQAAAAAIRVVGVQSTATSAMYDAFAAGRPIASAVLPTIADGLAGRVDDVSYTRARAVVDELVLVPESLLRPAIQQLFDTEGIIAEGAGIVSYAAIAESIISVDGPTVVIISGGNIGITGLCGHASEGGR